MDRIEIIIDKQFDNITIKEFLKQNNVGKAKIESIRVNKEAYLNNKQVDLETVIHSMDKLSFIINEKIDFEVDDSIADIVYEDDYLLAINKPLNMIIHPDDKSKHNTLVNVVANYYQNNQINRHIRYLHRIDKDTTGLVLFAKDFLSEAILFKDFKENKIKKYYLAFIENHLPKKQGVIDYKIGSDRHINNKMVVSKNGKEAITKYELIESYKDYDLVQFELITGRTHQIRVHSSYLKCPLLGDVLYGGNYQYINRVALQSYKIEFIHPISKQKITITCPLPEDLERLKRK